MANVQKECARWRIGPPIALFAAYAVMAFPDGIGVMAARFGMGSSASTLVFLWFAILPIAAGKLCGRIGGRRAVAISLAVAMPAFSLLWRGCPHSMLMAIGFAIAGIANVMLQTTVPVWAVEMFGTVRLSGVLTAGLFVKTVVAIILPFAIATLAAAGDWRMLFPLFAAVTASAVWVVWRSGPKPDAPHTSCVDAVSWRSVVILLKDRPTALVAVAFAVAIIADISFNLSVPAAVTRRFGGGDMETGLTYSVLFGVKLPAMFLGSMLFAKKGVPPFLMPALVISVVGSFVLFLSGAFPVYLCGVALFAFGYANMYGFVYGVAAPRHPSSIPSVSALLTMSIAGGALASPLVGAVSHFGSCSTEAFVFALTVALFGLFASVRRRT